MAGAQKNYSDLPLLHVAHESPSLAVSIISYHDRPSINRNFVAEIDIVERDVGDHRSLQKQTPHADIIKLQGVVSRIEIEIELARCFGCFVITSEIVEINVVFVVLEIKLVLNFISF